MTWHSIKKYRIPLLLVLLGLLVPLLLSICVANVGNVEWLAFWGSYLSGIATLVAVYWTINHNSSMVKKQIANNADMIKYQFWQTYLNTEKENIAKVLFKINSYVSLEIRHAYLSLCPDELKYKSSNIQERIISEMSRIGQLNSELYATSDLALEFDNCKTCKIKTCCPQLISKEKFKNAFISACKDGLKDLATIQQFISIHSSIYSENPKAYVKSKGVEASTEILHKFIEAEKEVKNIIEKIAENDNKNNLELAHLMQEYYLSRCDAVYAHFFKMKNDCSLYY